jgi:hypothetical protein
LAKDEVEIRVIECFAGGWRFVGRLGSGSGGAQIRRRGWGSEEVSWNFGQMDGVRGDL